jgi:hypothetical protein
MIKNNKKAQEEMVGFAFIIIIVAVILLIFISLSLNKPREEPNSYEVESFLQALMQSTTSCEDRLEFLTVQKLVSRCNTDSQCIDGRDTCDVLNETVEKTLSEVWQIKDRPVQGYEFEIISGQKNITRLFEGNKSNTYKGAIQLLPNELKILFKAYY